MTIEWDPQTMATGMVDIDEQHKEWLHRFNEFDSAVFDGGALETIKSMLDFLAGYTETHFRLEEARMTQCNCPAMKENRAAHEYFRVQLAEIQGWVS